MSMINHGSGGRARILLRIITIFTITAAVLIVMDRWRNSELKDTSVDFGRTQDFSEGWYYEMDGERIPVEALPFKSDAGEMIYRRELPDSGGEKQYLSFRNVQQQISVWVDETCIYEYGSAEPLQGKLLPSIQCFVPLGVQDGTHTLTVRVYSDLFNRTVLPRFRIGSEGAVLMEFLRNNLNILFFSVLMMGFALLLITAGIILYVKKIIKGKNLFISAGIFILLSSLWVLTDSSVMQLFTGRAEGVLMASFFFFMIFPIPMISFVEEICEKKYSGLFVLKMLFLINCIIQATLNVLAGYDFSHMLPVTHALMTASIIYMIVCLFREYRRFRSFYAKGILTALLVFMATAMVSFIDFYGNKKDYSVIMRLAMLAFAMVLIWISLKKLMVSAKEQTKINVYKSLAYMDIMTQCGNRAAFDRAVNALKRGEGLDNWFGMAMIDMNGLKQVNDTFGHGTGDQAITGAGACIREAFEGLGDVYRVGGDEFLIILRGKKLKEEEYRRRLAESMGAYNQSHKPALDLACGFAFTGPGKKDVDALCTEADRYMYREKQATVHRSGMRQTAHSVRT